MQSLDDRKERDSEPRSCQCVFLRVAVVNGNVTGMGAKGAGNTPVAHALERVL